MGAGHARSRYLNRKEAVKKMGETKLSYFKDKRWSLHGMTALVTGGTRGIGFVAFSNDL